MTSPPDSRLEGASPPEAASSATVVPLHRPRPPAGSKSQQRRSRARHHARDDLIDQLDKICGGHAYVQVLTAGHDPGLAGLLGYPPDVSQGITLSGLVHPEDAETAAAHRRGLAGLADGEFATLLCRLRRAEGCWTWIELRETVFERSHDGEVRRILGFGHDVSEQRRLVEQLAAASKALLTAESDERRRIARELHDSTAQYLVAIDLGLSRLERHMDEPPRQTEILHDIRDCLTAAHRELRTFSYLLHPPSLERLGFEGSLRRFLDGFPTRTGLRVALTIEGAPPRPRPVGELALFRVVQEALMNAHKHACASRVEVRLTYSDRGVTLEVEDDGIGLSASAIEKMLGENRGGVGISGMCARMEQIGGEIELLARPKGLVVRALLPYGQGALTIPRGAQSAPAPPHTPQPLR
jgi:signal transduction histidine kinase